MVTERHLIVSPEPKTMMYTNDLSMGTSPPPLQPIHRGLQQATPQIPATLSPQAAGEDRLSLQHRRRQREFIPEAKKDDCYWDRRRRNNEAAKRSREKRRLNDMLLERRVVELTKENWILKAQIRGVFESYGIRAEETLSGIAVDRILAAMPSNEQILSFGSRSGLRRSSFEVDQHSTVLAFSEICDDFPAKRPKLEIPDQMSSSEWSPTSSTQGSKFVPKCEDENWSQTEDESSSRSPAQQDSDDWSGPLNLSCGSSTSNSCDVKYDSTEQQQKQQQELQHVSHYLPHKLRYKYSIDENLSHEDSDGNSA